MDQGTQRLIKRHNAQMRDLIVRDIDALEDKLNVKRQVSHLTDNAVDTVKGKLGMNNRNPNESWVDFVRHNVGPLAAVGLGGTVLAKNIQSRVATSTIDRTGDTRYFDPAQPSGYATTGYATEDSSSEGLRDKVGSKLSGISDGASDGLGTAKDKVTGKVSETGSMVGEKAVHAKDAVVERIPSRSEAARAARDHGQLLGVAALAVGAVAGAFVPRTQAEERRLAPVQSTMRDKASDLAEQGVEKAKETADRATEALSAGVEMAKEEFAEPTDVDSTSGLEFEDTSSSMGETNRITGSRNGLSTESTLGTY